MRRIRLKGFYQNEVGGEGVVGMKKPIRKMKTVRTIVEKDGERQEVIATVTSEDADQIGLSFPDYLYKDNGFTLLWMEGEPDLK